MAKQAEQNKDPAIIMVCFESSFFFPPYKVVYTRVVENRLEDKFSVYIHNLISVSCISTRFFGHGCPDICNLF